MSIRIFRLLGKGEPLTISLLTATVRFALGRWSGAIRALCQVQLSHREHVQGLRRARQGVGSARDRVEFADERHFHVPERFGLLNTREKVAAGQAPGSPIAGFQTPVRM